MADGHGGEHRFFVPRMVEPGVYANQFAVWHTEHEFTLDFAVAKPLSDGDGREDVRPMPARVVVRVRLPVTMAFEVIRKLSVDMMAYEQRFGEIRRVDETEGDE